MIEQWEDLEYRAKNKTHTGYTHTAAAKTKMRDAWTPERLARARESNTGELNPAWKGGKNNKGTKQ